VRHGGAGRSAAGRNGDRPAVAAAGFRLTDVTAASACLSICPRPSIRTVPPQACLARDGLFAPPLRGQVWVYGDSTQPCLVAIVVPKEKALAGWAADNGQAVRLRGGCRLRARQPWCIVVGQGGRGLRECSPGQPMMGKALRLRVASRSVGMPGAFGAQGWGRGKGGESPVLFWGNTVPKSIIYIYICLYCFTSDKGNKDIGLGSGRGKGGDSGGGEPVPWRVKE
jgi:hypothetical protein